MTNWQTTRNIPDTNWNGRKSIQSDLGYFITQEGILCDNNGNKILFHTGIFYDKDTEWEVRKEIQ